MREWETKDLGADKARADGHSLPQIYNPAAIQGHLNRRREQLASVTSERVAGGR